MTPHQGQEGTQVVEDTEGFELWFQGSGKILIWSGGQGLARYKTTRGKHNTVEDMHMFEKYNWTYPGIIEGVRIGTALKGCTRVYDEWPWEAKQGRVNRQILEITNPTRYEERG